METFFSQQWKMENSSMATKKRKKVKKIWKIVFKQIIRKILIYEGFVEW